MNAIHPCRTEAEERIARHLRMGRELAELGMEMARAAARRAAQEAALEDDAARATLSGRARRTSPDSRLLFLRLSAAVRNAISLEARLAAGLPPSPPPAIRPGPDPRRATFRRVFHDLTEHQPDRAGLRRETTERLNQALAQDAEVRSSTSEILERICQDLGIKIDYATLSPDIRAAVHLRDQPTTSR